MQKYFNIFLEFNHKVFYSFIEDAIQYRKKGYVCVVDANVLTMAQNNLQYQHVLNNSLINTCDGSSIATLASWVHHQKYRALNGPEIFEYFIEKDYKHLFLGSTQEITDQIKEVLICKNMKEINIQAISLPFMPVESFDYQSIANKINKIEPDIIWVSLGAPKQEIFMNKIEPLLNHGVLFGIGAAFNFYIGKLTALGFKIGSLRFIWSNRLFNEPQKIAPRVISYILSLPALYLGEKKRKQILHK